MGIRATQHTQQALAQRKSAQVQEKGLTIPDSERRSCLGGDWAKRSQARQTACQQGCGSLGWEEGFASLQQEGFVITVNGTQDRFLMTHAVKPETSGELDRHRIPHDYVGGSVKVGSGGSATS